MIPWPERPLEEKALLNPSFCATLMWQAANGYATAQTTAMPLELAFLILPIVLPAPSRAALPRSSATSLLVWLGENPLLRARIADRARLLRPFTREALLFGSVRSFIRIDNLDLVANDQYKTAIAKVLRESTDEVRACAKASEFVGKWFGKVGSSTTVMAMIGVQP